VTFAYDLPAMDENRTDWDSALAHPLPGFFYGCFQK
jgi:hypothetical protein